jgi:hypothetical protein
VNACGLFPKHQFRAARDEGYSIAPRCTRCGRRNPEWRGFAGTANSSNMNSPFTPGRIVTPFPGTFFEAWLPAQGRWSRTFVVDRVTDTVVRFSLIGSSEDRGVRCMTRVYWTRGLARGNVRIVEPQEQGES